MKSNRNNTAMKALALIGYAVFIWGLTLNMLALPSNWNDLLFQYSPLTDQTLTLFDQFLFSFVLLTSLFSILTKKMLPMVFVSLILFSEYFLVCLLGGEPYSWLSPFDSAMRVLFPIILVLILQKKNWPKIAQWATAITFAAHGMKAYFEHPLFADYLYDFSNVFGPIISVPLTLKLIGVHDLIISYYALKRPRLFVWLWISLWGFITAIERIYFHGDSGVGAFLIRAPHFIIPMLVMLKSLEINSLRRSKEVSC